VSEDVDAGNSVMIEDELRCTRVLRGVPRNSNFAKPDGCTANSLKDSLQKSFRPSIVQRTRRSGHSCLNAYIGSARIARRVEI
jgi:hypothetical protein